jgi:hypothetical protein
MVKKDVKPIATNRNQRNNKEQKHSHVIQASTLLSFPGVSFLQFIEADRALMWVGPVH